MSVSWFPEEPWGNDGGVGKDIGRGIDMDIAFILCIPGLRPGTGRKQPSYLLDNPGKNDA
jgi:hypothetical protein